MQPHDLEKLAARRRWLRQVVAAVVTGGLAGSVGADGPLIPRFRFTHTGQMCCIPRSDYQYQARSPSVIAGSQTVQVITSVGNDQLIAAARNNVDIQVNQRKRFRPSRDQLRIDHCRISDIAIDFDRGGNWVMSLFAEQNPPLEPEQDLRFRQRLHLRRNAFVVEVRLFSSPTTSVAAVVESDQQSREPNPGRLIAAKIEPKPFWVQREEPRSLVLRGQSDEIARWFDELSAAEFEFFYQLDPQSAAGENVRRLNER